MASDLFKKYIWLVDTVYQYGPISFAEINRRWQRCSLSGGSNLALRTFHNHREAVEELFHIRIACDDRTNRYYIENGEALGTNALANWLLNSFSISNLLQESQALAGRATTFDGCIFRAGMQFDVPDAVKTAGGAKNLPFGCIS